MRLPPHLSIALVAALLLASGCGASSSSEDAAVVPAPVVGKTTTWSDGTVLKGTVTIPVGSTVSLAKGATVTAAKDAELVVAGTLIAPAGGTLGSEGWKGVRVVRGGQANLTGLALHGGLVTEAGALKSSLTSGSISQADAPFDVALDSTLVLKDVKVGGLSGVGLVKGTLEADHLSYDKGGNTGIVISGKQSVFRLTNSVLFGDGSFNGDMVNTDDAGELTVSNTQVKGTHCAFHLIGVDQLALSGLSIHNNAYGFMAYGSNPTKTQKITNSDVYDNRDFGLLESPGTTQGRMLVDGGFWGRNGDSPTANLSQISGKIERLNPATSPRA